MSLSKENLRALSVLESKLKAEDSFFCTHQGWFKTDFYDMENKILMQAQPDCWRLDELERLVSIAKTVFSRRDELMVENGTQIAA